MAVLVLGLALFLGLHSIRIVADGWRTATIARVGEKRWKGLYSMVSGIGFVLIIWGFYLARHQAVYLWTPIPGAPHAAGAVMLLVFMLLPAAHMPGNHLKTWLKHPMLIAVILWSAVHLCANGSSADAVLFGSFLVWAIVDLASNLSRPAPVVAPASLRGDVKVVVAGVIGWSAFVFFLHRFLFGVQPFPLG